MNTQEYYLTVLAEECAEVAKVCSKINRFGLIDNLHNRDNQKKLVEELNDLVATVGLLQEIDVVPEEFLCKDMYKAKIGKVKYYMESSMESGCLQVDELAPSEAECNQLDINLEVN